MKSIIDTKLIAICGVDGVGKSSIVNEMEKRVLLPECTYLRRPKLKNSNSALVQNFHSRAYHDSRDWIEGSFAEAMGVGLSFDFLEHYDQNIQPLLGKYKFIVCDRYSICYITYLKSIQSKFPIDLMFQNIKIPDKTFYIQIPLEILTKRYEKRGGIQDDENLEVMNNFHKSYQTFLEKQGWNYETVDNSSSLDVSVCFISEVIEKSFSETGSL